MHEEPKSMLRYVAVALILVAPVLYFIASHVDTKVAPLSGFVAQTVGVPIGNTRVAERDEVDVKR